MTAVLVIDDAADVRVESAEIHRRDRGTYEG